jgi:acyl carrier protein
VEELLAEVWARALGLDEVGVDHDFFALGGDSLMVLRVVNQLRKVFGVPLPIRALFEHRTIASLAPVVVAARCALEGSEGLGIDEPVVAGAPEEPAPLSFIQEHYLDLEARDPGRQEVIPLAFRIEEPVDRGALDRAVTEVVRRHHALRTAYVALDGHALQRVVAPPEVRVPCDEIASLDDDLVPAEVRHRSRRQAGERLALADGDLTRFRLLRFGGGAAYLLCTVHHIAFDVVSIRILARELSILYDAFRRGEPSPLVELPVQYPDHARWERRALQGDRLARRLSYWRAKLSGLPPPLALPSARARADLPDAEDPGDVTPFALSPDVSAKLRRSCREQAVTPFMFMLAAWKCVLARITGQADLVVEFPVANRARPEVESVVGMFANAVALRTDLGGDPRFTEVLGRVRDTCIEAFEHQDAPYGLVAEAAGGRAGEPLTSLGITYFDAGLTEETRAPRALRLWRLGTRTGASYDLRLYVHDGPGPITGELEFSRSRYRAEAMAELCARYRASLEQIVDGPERRLSDLLPEAS